MAAFAEQCLQRPQVMNASERTIVIIYRVIGISGLFAIPFIALPHAWMSAIHDYVGLGELPDIPIVSYLTRSLSGFYAVVSVIILYISRDIRRYRGLVRLWSILFIAVGVVLTAIDATAPMPLSWTLTEGPPTIVVGLVILWLSRKIQPEQESPDA